LRTTNGKSAHAAIRGALNPKNLCIRPDPDAWHSTLRWGYEEENIHLNAGINGRRAGGPDKGTQRTNVAGYTFGSQTSVSRSLPGEYGVGTQLIANSLSQLHVSHRRIRATRSSSFQNFGNRRTEGTRMPLAAQEAERHCARVSFDRWFRVLFRYGTRSYVPSKIDFSCRGHYGQNMHCSHRSQKSIRGR
jgi:hypothetical protein